MANILQGLGQSQAISGYLQGVNDLRQKALQEKTGEQALQMNDQSMAINKFKFDQMKAEEAAGNRVASMAPIFDQQKPEVQKVMKGLLSPYLETVQGVPNMVRAKNQKKMLDLLHHPEAAQLIGNAQKQDIINNMQELDNQIKQMTTPDAKTGKAPVSDSKGAEAYQELINKRADAQKQLNEKVGHLDALNKGITGYQEEELKQKQSKERIGLAEHFTPDSIDAFLNGTGQLVPNTKQMDEFQTFKSGTEGRATVADYEKATAKPVDSTARDEKLHSQLLAQSNSDAWKKTQLKFPKSGMSFNLNTADVSTGSGGDPAAVNFFVQERNKAVTARLRKVGLYNKYGDLYQTTTEPAARDITPLVDWFKGVPGKVGAGTMAALRQSKSGWSEAEIQRAAQQARIKYEPPVQGITSTTNRPPLSNFEGK